MVSIKQRYRLGCHEIALVTCGHLGGNRSRLTPFGLPHRGLVVGARELEEERAASVHWRNPHLCLFWTGTGGNTPVIKIRRGSLVSASLMANVPTGYLGPEPASQSAT